MTLLPLQVASCLQVDMSALPDPEVPPVRNKQERKRSTRPLDYPVCCPIEQSLYTRPTSSDNSWMLCNRSSVYWVIVDLQDSELPSSKRPQGAVPASSHGAAPNPGPSIHTADAAALKLAHGNAGPDSQWIPQHQHGPGSSMPAAAAAGSGQCTAIIQQPSSKESSQKHVNGSVLASSAAAVGKVRGFMLVPTSKWLSWSCCNSCTLLCQNGAL